MRKIVLFVGGGRRTSLAELFIKEGFEVYSYETSEQVPVSQFATVIKGYKWNDPNIVNHFLGELQRLKNLTPYVPVLIIPLMDEATKFVSQLQYLSGMHELPVAGWMQTDICLDKKLFEEFMLENFKDYFPYYIPNEEYIIKPRKGFGSKGIKKNPPTITLEEDEVLQRLIKGTEYSVDAYFNKDNHYIDSVVRERLRVFDGEVISSAVDYQPKLSEITKEIGEKLQLQGPTCFQFIIERGTWRPYLIEINARFGGGYTLTHAAGLNMISMLDKEYVQQLNYDWNYLVPENGIIKKKFLRMERSFRDTFFEL